eukprot:1142894-Pelagomonas_calceolata.AAC.2
MELVLGTLPIGATNIVSRLLRVSLFLSGKPQGKICLGRVLFVEGSGICKLCKSKTICAAYFRRGETCCKKALAPLAPFRKIFKLLARPKRLQGALSGSPMRGHCRLVEAIEATWFPNRKYGGAYGRVLDPSQSRAMYGIRLGPDGLRSL